MCAHPCWSQRHRGDRVVSELEQLVVEGHRRCWPVWRSTCTHWKCALLSVAHQGSEMILRRISGASDRT